MELKVWVEGIQRTVCGVTDKTTCQDVVYALAHATGKTGRFTLIESWRNNERLLAPQEHPLKVLNKWGEYSQEVQFILQRSSLDGMKNPGMLQPSLHHPGHQFKPPGPMLSPQMSRANLGPPAHPYAAAAGGIRPPHHSAGPPGAMGGLLAKAPAASHPTTTMGEPPAVWKPPPPGYPPPPQGHGAHTRKGGHYHPAQGSAAASNNNHNEVGARLSPDSGRGSDKTGSDTSNSYTENNKDSSSSLKNNNGSSSSKKQQVVTASQNGGYNGNVHRSQSTSQMGWGRLGGGGPQAEESPYGFSKQTSVPVLKGGGALPPPAYKPPPNPASSISSASPADQPPPYREPPPPPGGGRMLRQASSPSSGLPQPPSTVRPPHYSPPPTHKTHLSRHPSRTSLVGAAGGAIGGSGVGSGSSSSLARTQHHHPRGKVPSNQQQHPPTDMTELLNLVTAQQSTLQAQQADIRQFEAEEAGFSTHGESSVDTGAPTHPGGAAAVAAVATSVVPSAAPAGSQMDLVLSEVRRLEELSQRNDDELKFLNSERAQMESEADTNIRSEIMQLKQRLAGTDVELQRTNTTLRRLGDEMRNMSLEKTRQREQELVQEADRLQNEIKLLQKSSEDSANISQQLSKDVKEVEGQIRQRKSEVEQLIKEMREANMESLAISPPEESKQFLEGPPKPNTSRKMMGSPRQLENAVPTSRNPHGVWV